MHLQEQLTVPFYKQLLFVFLTTINWTYRICGRKISLHKKTVYHLSEKKKKSIYFHKESCSFRENNFRICFIYTAISFTIAILKNVIICEKMYVNALIIRAFELNHLCTLAHKEFTILQGRCELIVYNMKAPWYELGVVIGKKFREHEHEFGLTWLTEPHKYFEKRESG